MPRPRVDSVFAQIEEIDKLQSQLRDMVPRLIRHSQVSEVTKNEVTSKESPSLVNDELRADGTAAEIGEGKSKKKIPNRLSSTRSKENLPRGNYLAKPSDGLEVSDERNFRLQGISAATTTLGPDSSLHQDINNSNNVSRKRRFIIDKWRVPKGLSLKRFRRNPSVLSEDPEVPEEEATFNDATLAEEIPNNAINIADVDERRRSGFFQWAEKLPKRFSLTSRRSTWDTVNDDSPDNGVSNVQRLLADLESNRDVKSERKGVDSRPTRKGLVRFARTLRISREPRLSLAVEPTEKLVGRRASDTSVQTSPYEKLYQIPRTPKKRVRWMWKKSKLDRRPKKRRYGKKPDRSLLTALLHLLSLRSDKGIIVVPDHYPGLILRIAEKRVPFDEEAETLRILASAAKIQIDRGGLAKSEADKLHLFKEKLHHYLEIIPHLHLNGRVPNFAKILEEIHSMLRNVHFPGPRKDEETLEIAVVKSEPTSVVEEGTSTEIQSILKRPRRLTLDTLDHLRLSSVVDSKVHLNKSRTSLFNLFIRVCPCACLGGETAAIYPRRTRA